MLWRFFAVIWLSIMTTLVALIVVSVALGLGPPRGAEETADAHYLMQMAVAAYQDGGEAALLRLQKASAQVPAAPRLTFGAATGTACTQAAGADTRIVAHSGGCEVITVRRFHLSAYRRYGRLALAGVAALLIAGAAAALLARYFNRPLATVSGGLAALSSGNLRYRIGSRLGERSDEIGRLATTFDNAATQLELLNQTQQRLFHDVSHEIRSPLARLQAATGVLRKTPSRLEAMLPRIETEVTKLDRLVDEILVLARLEYSGKTSLMRQRLDLVDLIHAIVDDATFEGQPRRVTCHYEGPASIEAEVNGDLIHRALENVIRNAIRHTGDGTEVRVQATVDRDRAVARIAVTDRGPGVPEDELGAIFSPFVRAQNAPGAGGANLGGAGLGLTISARAVRIHGGEVLATLPNTGGLRVTLEIPVPG